ncbi:C4-dicarboxylate ABC transporter substrate-binding protein [Thalassospira profundimaris]|uniref:C4-dicarboxylate ABC transporter substrate-binding protein n=1 Tax=Thalassospira profundimaris TaxID=502049 RepID=A0A367WYK1_9PROT|nr:TRAP transporter substrate-binding protein [Thalassospira profundimaris]RCK46525.1 C4-dicarboxylate ABC transporter substrate-binding protein [Thalassospira profundimaris]
MSGFSINRRQMLGLMGGALAAPAIIGKAKAAEVTLRLHHFLPPVAPMHKAFFEPWAKEIREQSDGRIDIQIFPAMQLGGKPSQIADQVANNVVDIGWTLTVYTPGRYPVAETASLPFMITNAEATSVAMHKFMDEFGQDEYRGMKPLAFHVHASGKFHMRDKAIEKQADLEGLQIRAPNQSFGRALSILGAEPVFFPVTEMAVGLANGVIDGTCLPYEVVPAFKLHELTSVHCSTPANARGLYANSFALLMAGDAYDGLPDDLKAIMDANSGLELSRRIGKQFDTFEEVGRKMCAEHGNKFVEIPKAEVDRWQAASQPVIDDWIETLNDAGHDGKAMIDRLNQLIDAETA